MPRRIVAMSLIPGIIYRGTRKRTDLSYAAYSRQTWEWWCEQHDATFVPIEANFGGPHLQGAPPTFLRWLAPAVLFERYGAEAQIMMVDADTMIRWDTPDIFSIAGARFSVARGGHPGWIVRSIEAFRRFFPNVSLEIADYFNAGLIAFRREHIPIFENVLRFYTVHRAELDSIFRASNIGTDQTPLNFVVKASGCSVCWLPSEYNFLHCVGGSVDYLRQLESSGFTGTLPEGLLCAPETFAFIDRAYVWHFTNTFSTRSEFMKQTWERISSRY